MSQAPLKLPTTIQPTSNQSDFVKADVWLNVGFTDADGHFQSPMKGIPVDTSKAPTFGGQENLDTYEAIQEIASDLAEGEFVDLEMTVRVYRKKSAMTSEVATVATRKQSLIKK